MTVQGQRRNSILLPLQTGRLCNPDPLGLLGPHDIPHLL